MCTARLVTVHVSVSVLEGDPQMNKFEQVLSDDHQMSLAAAIRAQYYM